ncbi:MAG: hypothetical protein WA882_18815 [Geitlerinemataceae cyanobacterium]
MIPCRLFAPKDGYRLVAICLNRVNLRGLTSDEAMKTLGELNFTPELRYQWNYDRQELDVYAVICEEPLEEWSLGDDRDDELSRIFGSEAYLYAIGATPDGDDSQWIARRELENVPPPPPKPSWYSQTVVEGDREKTRSTI